MGLSTAPSEPGHKWQMGKDGVAALGYRVLSRRCPAACAIACGHARNATASGIRSAADSILIESVMDRARFESGASLDNRGSGGRATCHRYRLASSEGSG